MIRGRPARRKRPGSYQTTGATASRPKVSLCGTDCNRVEWLLCAARRHTLGSGTHQRLIRASIKDALFTLRMLFRETSHFREASHV